MAAVSSGAASSPSGYNGHALAAAAAAGAYAVLFLIYTKGIMGASPAARWFGRINFWPSAILVTALDLSIMPRVAPRWLFGGRWAGNRKAWFHEIVPGVYLGAAPLVWPAILYCGSPQANKRCDGRTNGLPTATTVTEATVVTTGGVIGQLHALGVRACVNCLDEWAGPVETYRKLRWSQLHLPTIDHTEPDVEALVAGALFIAKVRRGGTGTDGVFVHCKAGHGRSAAVVFCYLYAFGSGEKLGEIPQSTLSETRLRETQDMLLRARKVRSHLWLQHNVRQACLELSTNHILANQANQVS